MPQWYYRIRKEEFGPVADLQLAALLADGTLRPTDEVRADGEFKWRPASAALSFHASSATAADEWSANDLDSMLAGGNAPAEAGVDDLDQLLAGAEDSADSLDLDRMLAPSAATSTVSPGSRRTPAAPVPAAAPEDESDMWFYKSLGQELGPVPYAEIENLARNGELSPKDYIRPGRNGAWQRAGRISGLFADDYEQEQARLKEAAAKIALSSQRLGERAFVALQAQASMPEVEDEAAAEPVEAEAPEEPEEEAAAVPEPVAEAVEPPSVSTSKSRRALKSEKQEQRKKISKKAAQKSEDLAADLLSEFEDEEPEERPAARTAPTRARAAEPVESDAATTPTRSNMSMPTPAPPTRTFTPPPPTPSSASGFKKAPRSMKFALPFDGKQGMIGAVVVLVLVGGYFAPWGSLFGASPGPKLFERATVMWGKVKMLHENKKAKEADWEKLETELVTTINLHLAELKPYTRKNNLAASLYLFERDGLQNILSKGAKASDEDFKQAEDYLLEAKKHMPKP